MCFASLLYLGVTKKTPIHYCATVVVFLWKTSLEENFTLDIYALSNANNTSKLWAILPPHISSCLIPDVWTFFTFDLSAFLTVPWSWLAEILNVAQSLLQWQRKEQIPKWFCQYSVPSQIFSTVFSSRLCWTCVWITWSLSLWRCSFPCFSVVLVVIKNENSLRKMEQSKIFAVVHMTYHVDFFCGWSTYLMHENATQVVWWPFFKFWSEGPYCGHHFISLSFYWNHKITSFQDLLKF